MKSFEKKFKKYDTVSLSIPGSKIEDAFQTLNSVVLANREVVDGAVIVILLGTNDFLRNRRFNREDFYSIVKAATIVCTKVLLVKVPPIPLLPELNGQICIENEWISSFATEEKVLIVDPLKFHDPEASVDLDLFETTYFSGKTDLIHLNQRGLRILANSILQHLEVAELAEYTQPFHAEFESDEEYANSCNLEFEFDEKYAEPCRVTSLSKLCMETLTTTKGGPGGRSALPYRVKFASRSPAPDLYRILENKANEDIEEFAWPSELEKILPVKIDRINSVPFHL